MPSPLITRARAAISAVMAIAVLVVASAAPAQGQAPDTTTTTTPPPDPSGLTISPAIVDDVVNPGTTFTTPLTLGNITDVAVPIQAARTPLESDQYPDPAAENKYDISSWISVDSPSFLLAPQERKTVNATVTVPPNAEPGGHYATTYFSALPPGGGESGKTLLNARVGAVFFITVRGDVHTGAKLAGPIRTQSWQWEAGASTFNFGIENTGNAHFQPAGKLVIKDLFGRKVKELPLPQGILLPGGKRNYDLSWERGVRPGIYSAQLKIDAGVPLNASSKRFVILPLVILIPAAIVLFGILFAVLHTWLRRKRRAKQEAAKSVVTAPEPGEELESETDQQTDPSNEEQQ